jgi:DNA-binding response OmpR family regulator/nitrogen-specific signal transduction histidine kinase
LREANQKLEAEVQNRTQKIESDKQIIEDQARELRSLDEMKSRFFTNITHELRTPLTLILGPLQSLLKSDRLSEKDRNSMLLIQRNAGRLLNLVEELLDLSKMEANKLVLAEKPVQLYLFLARIMASFLPYAEHRRVALKLKYNCPNNLALMMDEQKWEKILNNLLNNALKFTPGGGSITMETDMREGDLVLTVKDTGTGIHPDDLPYIFDRYYQARNAESTLQGGAGIGLSLCREYVKLFGGDISVQSTVGTGSKFTLSCPLKPAPDTDPEMNDNEITFSVASEFQQAPAAHNPAKRTVLLVEDDRDMSDYVQSILSPDYNLITAENGQIALNLLENNTVDLILSDLMMPEMDGMQLLQTVRERYLDIPFIMLTARADAPDRLHALTLGVDDYLTKPFQVDELTVRLGNLIGRYDTRKAAQASNSDSDQTARFDEKWIRQLEKLVLENISNTNFLLADLADQLNMSKRSLHNKVVACTGMSPNQYLTEIRLNRARYLMETRAFGTMAEVCYAVGFKTPHYFSKLMKERFGGETDIV